MRQGVLSWGIRIPPQLHTAAEVLHNTAAEKPRYTAAGALCVSDHFGIVSVVNDHLGQRGIVAVNNDVDVVFLHNADVSLGVDGAGSAEHNVGERQF